MHISPTQHAQKIKKKKRKPQPLPQPFRLRSVKTSSRHLNKNQNTRRENVPKAKKNHTDPMKGLIFGSQPFSTFLHKFLAKEKSQRAAREIKRDGSRERRFHKPIIKLRLKVFSKRGKPERFNEVQHDQQSVQSLRDLLLISALIGCIRIRIRSRSRSRPGRQINAQKLWNNEINAKNQRSQWGSMWD